MLKDSSDLTASPIRLIIYNIDQLLDSVGSVGISQISGHQPFGSHGPPVVHGPLVGDLCTSSLFKTPITSRSILQPKVNWCWTLMEAPSLPPDSIGSKPSWDSSSHGTAAGSCRLQKELMALLIAEFQGTVMSSAQEKNTHSTLPLIQEDNLSYMLVTLSQVLV